MLLDGSTSIEKAGTQVVFSITPVSLERSRSIRDFEAEVLLNSITNRTLLRRVSERRQGAKSRLSYLDKSLQAMLNQFFIEGLKITQYFVNAFFFALPNN